MTLPAPAPAEAAHADIEVQTALMELNGGDALAALAHVDAALDLAPAHAGALRLRARLRLDAGAAREALAAAESVLRAAPLDGEALALKARALDRLADPLAQATLAALEARADHDFAAALGRALLALDRKDGADALRWLDRAVALDPKAPAARALRASCLARLGRSEAALAEYGAALQLQPRSLRALLGRARLSAALGAFADAEVDLRAALEAAPGHPPAYAALLGLRPSEEAQLCAQAMERLGAPNLTNAHRIELGYAVAKSLARAGKPGEAFASAARANALQAAAAPFAPQAERARLDRDLALPPRPGGELAAPQPIFVCGLPRSGTTLMEQILARHSQVAAGGELPFFRKAATWLEGRSDPVAALARHREELAAAYRQGLAERAQGRAFVIDKMPENWRHLGLIQHVLGPIRILRMLRDPRDAALSIFLEHFAPEARFAHDPDGIAFTMGEERRAFVHWARAGARPVVTVAYEALVCAPDREIPGILAALNLPFEAACLTPELGAAPAATPSRWQVRQKINTGAIGRWRAFAPYAPGFFAGIAAAAGEPQP